MKHLLVTLFLLSFSLLAKEGGYSFFNPAKLVDVNKITVDVLIQGSSEPKVHSGEGAFTVPVGLYQSGALRVKKHRKIDGFSGFSSSFLYAISLTNKLSIGGAIGYLNYEDTALHHRGVLDLGINYRIANHPVLGQHQVGLCANNILGASSGLRERLESPSNINASWDGVFWDQRIDVVGRAGFNFSDTSFLYGVSFTFDPLFIAGIKAELTDEFWHTTLIKEFWPPIELVLSLSYGQYRDGEAFLGLSASKEIGYHREQIHVRKNTTCCSVRPSELWRKMLKAKVSQNYFQSLEVGGRLVSEFPDFFNSALVFYHIGSVFMELDCRNAAQQVLTHAASKLKGSKELHICNLTLLKVAAVHDNGADINTLYTSLQDSTVDDSLQAVSHYYMGEYYLRQSEYAQAVVHFQKVQNGESLYQSAQDNIRIAEYYLRPGAIKKQKASPLSVQITKGREAYEKAGVEYWELIKVHQTSYTIQLLNELEKEMAPYRLLLDQYKLEQENEKKRILQLSGE